MGRSLGGSRFVSIYVCINTGCGGGRIGTSDGILLSVRSIE